MIRELSIDLETYSDVDIKKCGASQNQHFLNMISIIIISAPLAIFLDIILDAISGIDSTVPVTSRRAYIFLSESI